MLYSAFLSLSLNPNRASLRAVPIASRLQEGDQEEEPPGDGHTATQCSWEQNNKQTNRLSERSEPSGAPAQTSAQDGRGPPAESSHAYHGPAERRRSSVIVVELDPHHAEKDAAARVAAAVVQQFGSRSGH